MEQSQARSLASNTVRGYASDWKDFVAWCAAQGRKSLLAEVDTACLYLVDCAQRPTKATLNWRFSQSRDECTCFARRGWSSQ
jgi:site-specific recombinase XerD